jgi:hypothetical protein
MEIKRYLTKADKIEEVKAAVRVPNKMSLIVEENGEE